MLTAEQKALRRTGIFASEIAALARLSPWASPWDVFNAKVLGIEREQTFQMELGDLMEPVNLELFRRRTGAVLTYPGTVKHPTLPIGATPDAMWNADAVQAKNCMPWHREEFGEPGTDRIPAHYLVQTQFEMHVLGAKVCHVPVLFGTQEFQIYRVEYDAELGARLEGIALDFWKTHVEPRNPPPIDATPGCSVFLSETYPVNRAEYKPATDEAVELGKRAAAAKAQAAKWKRESEEHANKLKALIGDADGIDGVASWRANKNGKRSFRLKTNGEETQDE